MSKYIYIFLFIALIGGWLYIYKIHQTRIFSKQDKNTSTQQKYTDIISEELYKMLKNKDFYFVNVHIPYEGG